MRPTVQLPWKARQAPPYGAIMSSLNSNMGPHYDSLTKTPGQFFAGGRLEMIPLQLHELYFELCQYPSQH